MALRLFIVEDHQDIADSLSELLAVGGVCETVAKVRSEADALAWSFHNEAGFDVAIVDLILREGSGFPVIYHLHKYQPGKVVVFSDYVTPEIAARCKLIGAVAAFQKTELDECIRFVRGLAR